MVNKKTSSESNGQEPILVKAVSVSNNGKVSVFKATLRDGKEVRVSAAALGSWSGFRKALALNGYFLEACEVGSADWLKVVADAITCGDAG